MCCGDNDGLIVVCTALTNCNLSLQHQLRSIKLRAETVALFTSSMPCFAILVGLYAIDHVTLELQKACLLDHSLRKKKKRE